VFHDEPLTPIAPTAPCATYRVTPSVGCGPEWHTYGRGLRTVARAGIVEIDIPPSARAASVLRRAQRKRRAGFPVTVVLAFRSAYGGAPVTHVVTALATLHRPH